MIVGHNPSFSYFAQYLSGDQDCDIPTCGVVGIELPLESWKEVTSDTGTIILQENPKALKKNFDYKAMASDIARDILESSTEILDEINTGITKKMKKPLKQHSREIAKTFVKQMKKMS